MHRRCFRVRSVLLYCLLISLIAGTSLMAQESATLDEVCQVLKLTEAETQGTGELIFAEMSNEHVQVYGDVAILSYNYMGLAKDKEGKVEPTTAKSSRVYVKRDNDWWLVHANFAPVSE